VSGQALNLKALAAAEVMERLANVAASLPPGPIQWAVTTNVGALGISAQAPKAAALSTDPSFTQLLEMVRGRRHVLCRTAYVHSNANPHSKVTYTCDDGLSGRIEITAQNPAEALALLKAVEDLFNVAPLEDLVGVGPLADSERAAMKARERSVADLREEIGKLATFLSELSQKEVENRRQFQQQLELDFRQKADVLDSEHKAKLASVDERKAQADAEVASKEQALEQRVAQFNTKEAKFVRRDLLTQLTNLLKESEALELSKGTQKKRGLVHVFVWIMLLASGGLAAAMAYKVLNGSPDWHFLGPMAGGTLTFFATLVYYLKWNDRWFREHAEVELASKRYKSDIVRASWVAELVSEWAAEDNKELPKELVEAFTRNLFNSVGPVRESEHPIEFLGNMMKRAEEIDFSKGRIAIRGKQASDAE
jgi:hypothetical protein